MKGVNSAYGVDSDKFKGFFADKGILPGNFKLRPISIENVLNELMCLDVSKRHWFR